MRTTQEDTRIELEAYRTELDARGAEQDTRIEEQEFKRLLSETEWRNISTRKLELDTRARRRSAREVEMASWPVDSISCHICVCVFFYPYC